MTRVFLENLDENERERLETRARSLEQSLKGLFVVAEAEEPLSAVELELGADP